MKAILIVSHGSQSPKTKEEVDQTVLALKQRIAGTLIKSAYLEIEQPSIPEGIDECVNEGAIEIVILLNFLNSGKHVDGDIPDIVREAEEKYPEVNFFISKPLSSTENIISSFIELLDQLDNNK